jgi:hypothetical protein
MRKGRDPLAGLNFKEDNYLNLSPSSATLSVSRPRVGSRNMPCSSLKSHRIEQEPYPRSIDRGLIEARCSRPSPASGLASIRDQLIAASLKQGPLPGIRGMMQSYPRSIDRGLIEAKRSIPEEFRP